MAARRGELEGSAPVLAFSGELVFFEMLFESCSVFGAIVACGREIPIVAYKVPGHVTAWAR